MGSPLRAAATALRALIHSHKATIAAMVSAALLAAAQSASSGKLDYRAVLLAALTTLAGLGRSPISPPEKSI